MIDLGEYTMARRKYLRSIEAYCVYVICPDRDRPCRIDITMDLPEAHRLLQRGCWFNLRISFALWTPDKTLARRIESGCQAELEIFRLDGDWFDVGSDAAVETIQQKAKTLYPTASLLTHAVMVDMLKHKVVAGWKRSAA